MTEVHASFRAFVARRFGDEGRAWLAALPRLLSELADTWSIRLGEELPGGVLSCVVAAGDDAVLKVCNPWSRWQDEELALRAWSGRATPRLLAADPERRALLLERVRPGASACGADGAAAAGVLRVLHRPAPDSLPPLGAVARERVHRALEDGRTTPYKAEWAQAKIDELEGSPPPPVLLHGDFDERNLLQCARRGLAAIDPLPCAGDPAYDAGYWAHANGRPGRRARTTAVAGALGLPVTRVRAWCAVVAVHG